MNIRKITGSLSVSMTGGADVGRVSILSLCLALIAASLTIPYFHHLIFSTVNTAPSMGGDGWTFLWLQMSLLLILLFLSALIGFSFSDRLGLPAMGTLAGYLRALPFLIVGGAAIALVTYLVFDRYLFAVYPHLVPTGLVYLVFLPFKVALTNETILRLGLVTIGVGVTRSRGAGVIVISAIASLFTVKYFEYQGVPFDLNPLFVAHLTVSFIGNLILGWLYVTRGLACSMTLAFVIGWKYLIIWWLVG